MPDIEDQIIECKISIIPAVICPGCANHFKWSKITNSESGVLVYFHCKECGLTHVLRSK